MFMQPINAATWRGVSPDSVVAWIPEKIRQVKVGLEKD